MSIEDVKRVLSQGIEASTEDVGLLQAAAEQSREAWGISSAAGIELDEVAVAHNGLARELDHSRETIRTALGQIEAAHNTMGIIGIHQHDALAFSQRAESTAGDAHDTADEAADDIDGPASTTVAALVRRAAERATDARMLYEDAVGSKTPTPTAIIHEQHAADAAAGEVASASRQAMSLQEELARMKADIDENGQGVRQLEAKTAALVLKLAGLMDEFGALLATAEIQADNTTIMRARILAAKGSQEALVGYLAAAQERIETEAIPSGQQTISEATTRRAEL